MLKKRKVKDKYIKLFVIKDHNNEFSDEEKTRPYILSIVASKAQAEEFINKKLLIDNESHFLIWCKLKNLGATLHNWNLYKKIIIGNSCSYYYEKVKFNYSSVAGIARLFYECKPIGCSFDTLVEVATAAVLKKEYEEEQLEEQLEENQGNQKPN